MERILYAYILTVDNGQSPCYDDSIYTLACCKPQIRRIILQNWKNKIDNKKAEVWICGVRRNRKTKEPFIVYLSKIDKVMKLEEYYLANGAYSDRNDCYYRNVHTIYDKNGKLPVSRTSDEIHKYCPKIYALKDNEHGQLKQRQQLTVYHCRDIHGGAVLLSEHFIHCSCNCFTDNLELTQKLLPAFDVFLIDAKTKTQGHWHSFSAWNEFDEVISNIEIGKHADVKPLDVSAEHSRNRKKSCSC